MNKGIGDIKALQKHARAMGGVFTLPDIATLASEPHKKELYRRIERLEQGGILKRFARGIYITEGYSQRVLSQKLNANSYISFGNVLADAIMIGSLPAFQIDAVSLGRTRSFSKEGLTLRYFGISKPLFFGFEPREGIKTALPEKALLDTLYFHQHGAKFFFDIFSDVDVSKLNRKKLNTFLSHYKNPKFKTFVKDYLDERGLAKDR